MLAAGWLATRVVPRAMGGLARRKAVAQELQRSLARASELIAAEPALRESLAVRARALLGQAESLFAGGTPSEAAAELSSFVSGAGAVRFVHIARLDAAAEAGEGLFRRVTVRVEAEGDVTGIATWIADLERSPRTVRITDLWISASEPGAPVAQAERLRVEARLSALAVVTPRLEGSN